MNRHFRLRGIFAILLAGGLQLCGYCSYLSSAMGGDPAPPEPAGYYLVNHNTRIAVTQHVWEGMKWNARLSYVGMVLVFVGVSGSILMHRLYSAWYAAGIDYSWVILSVTAIVLGMSFLGEMIGPR